MAVAVRSMHCKPMLMPWDHFQRPALMLLDIRRGDCIGLCARRTGGCGEADLLCHVGQSR